MAAAALLGRVACGCELSAGYCDVILRRIWNLTGETPLLISPEDGSTATFQSVAAARGVPIEQALNPKAQDSRAIKHHGPNPHYGPKRKTA